MMFDVTAREAWTQTYRVDAENPEDAIRKVKADVSLAETVGDPEYSHMLDSDTWDVARVSSTPLPEIEITVRDLSEEYDGPTYDLRWEYDGTVYVSDEVFSSQNEAAQRAQRCQSFGSYPAGFPLEGGREAQGAMRPGSPSFEEAHTSQPDYTKWERSRMAGHLQDLTGIWETESLKLYGQPGSEKVLVPLVEEIRRLRSLLSFRFSTVEFVVAWGDSRWETREGFFLSEEVSSFTKDELVWQFLHGKGWENLSFCGVMSIHLNPDPME